VSQETMTYGQLDALLDRLGFTRQTVERREPGTQDRMRPWLRYEEPRTDTVILLVRKEPSERLRASDDWSAREHLVRKGLIGEAELAHFLETEVGPVKASATQER
jgi:hypothetical protein